MKHWVVSISIVLALGCSGARSGTSSEGPATPSGGPTEPAAEQPSSAEPAQPSSTGEPTSAEAGEPTGPATPPAEGATPPSDPAPSGAGAWFSSPRASASIFASGHSLMDGIFDPPDRDGGPLAALARSAGRTHRSVFQSGAGSTTRLRHEDISARRYPTPDWASFDTLIITERADPANTVIWEHTVAEIGWFVRQVRGAAPGGDEIFIYQTWFGFGPGGRDILPTWPVWAEYQRTELGLYECIAAAVAHDTGATVRVIPAALALAELVLAIQAGRIPGATVRDVLDADQVHASPRGKAFLAMVVFASVYRTPATGLEISGLPPALRSAMQSTADRVVSEYFAAPPSPAPSVASCRQLLSQICLRFGDGCDYYLPTGFPDGSL